MESLPETQECEDFPRPDPSLKQAKRKLASELDEKQLQTLAALKESTAKKAIEIF